MQLSEMISIPGQDVTNNLQYNLLEIYSLESKKFRPDDFRDQQIFKIFLILGNTLFSASGFPSFYRVEKEGKTFMVYGKDTYGYINRIHVVDINIFTEVGKNLLEFYGPKITESGDMDYEITLPKNTSRIS